MRHISHYPGQHVHPLLAKTATGEMSEADLTRDGEWGFWVEVADAVGGTIHPFDKYQGPYIRYNGNKFWLVSDENGGELIYNETTDELRPSPLFFEGTDVAYIAEQIRDMARTSSRKTASQWWVNGYHMFREHGGPEEGGWGYDQYIPTGEQWGPFSNREEAMDVYYELQDSEVDRRNAGQPQYPHESSGDGLFVVMVEDHEPRRDPETRPRYE